MVESLKSVSRVSQPRSAPAREAARDEASLLDDVTVDIPSAAAGAGSGGKGGASMSIGSGAGGVSFPLNPIAGGNGAFEGSAEVKGTAYAAQATAGGGYSVTASRGGRPLEKLEHWEGEDGFSPGSRHSFNTDGDAAWDKSVETEGTHDPLTITSYDDDGDGAGDWGVRQEGGTTTYSETMHSGRSEEPRRTKVHDDGSIAVHGGGGETKFPPPASAAPSALLQSFGAEALQQLSEAAAFKAAHGRGYLTKDDLAAVAVRGPNPNVRALAAHLHSNSAAFEALETANPAAGGVRKRADGLLAESDIAAILTPKGS